MYSEQQLAAVARRENNTKRKYLVVNRLQGKHVPVSPREAFRMFTELAEQVRKAYAGERLLLVGFAETATAIGAKLAVELGTLYMQTTREMLPGVEYLYFSESHSHATEQKLVKDDIDRVIDTIDRILFVEDEVTTGNTIRKIVDILESRYPGKPFAVASLLNGMDEAAQEVYRSREIPVHYLVKTDHESYTEIAERYRGDGVYIDVDERMPDAGCTGAAGEHTETLQAGGWRELRIDGGMNARRCISAQEYHNACEDLWKTIEEQGWFVDKESVLVLGTEEFMYPALYAAGKIEDQGVFVRCHATTRSPIAVSGEEEYPLHRRYELRSLYEAGRKTFIYDLEKYDAVLILTDAEAGSRQEKGSRTDGGREMKEGSLAGICTLVNALRFCGNEEIFLVRWCGA